MCSNRCLNSRRSPRKRSCAEDKKRSRNMGKYLQKIKDHRSRYRLKVNYHLSSNRLALSSSSLFHRSSSPIGLNKRQWPKLVWCWSSWPRPSTALKGSMAYWWENIKPLSRIITQPLIPECLYCSTVISTVWHTLTRISESAIQVN